MYVRPSASSICAPSARATTSGVVETPRATQRPRSAAIRAASAPDASCVTTRHSAPRLPEAATSTVFLEVRRTVPHSDLRTREGGDMARTPLGRWLEAAAGEARQEHDDRLTRGQVLKRAGLVSATLAGAGALGRFAPLAEGAGAPSIAVVGAGLAGLSAAYSLRQAGYAAEVYEASDRVGGRCWTDPRSLRRRTDRGARRRVDRPGPHADPPARAGTRPEARQPARGRGERHRAAHVLRRSAVHLGSGLERSE